MQNVRIGLLGALALASTLVVNGCNGGSEGGSSGGAPGSGGSSTSGAASGGAQASGGAKATGGSGSGGASSGGAGSGGAQASGGTTGSGGQTTKCPNGTPCGGDLVGTWDVTSSCLTLSGDMDVELASLGCPTVPVTGSLQVTGTWTANADGTYTDGTITTGSMTFPLDAKCLSISSVDVECAKIGSIFTALGWKTATCATNSSGQCGCSATANQKGGLGVVSPWASETGTYTKSGSDLKTDDTAEYSYCVAGGKLTVIPKPTILPITGTIVLQKQGPSATGGTTGQGGGTGTGGRTGTGGVTTGTGGRTGTGGTGTGTGGTTGGMGGRTGTGGVGTGGSTGGSTGTGSRPCDIYAAANNTCVAAHSTVRALFASYSGPLYQVRRASDKTTKDIGVLTPGGVADANAQDTFCSGTTCAIVQVYDQTKNGNHIGCQSADGQCPNEGKDSPASATNESLMISGQKVYALKMKPANAYWRDGSKSGMPLGNSPQGIYMVTSGKYYNAGCCFDYGNGPTTRKMSGGGTMDALYFGNSTQWGSGNGTGPWVMADLEGGIWSQGGSSVSKNNNVLSLPHTYVTAVEKNNGTSEFALRGGDATTGNLATFYKGGLPNNYRMQKQGAIILGSGGDCCYSNSNASQGTMYEGAIVSGYPSDATDEAVQANVVTAGYGK